MNSVLLKDALHNLSQSICKNNHQIEYGKGILVGVVAAYLATTGKTFHEAIESITPFLPRDVNIECFPESWSELIVGEINYGHKR
jgi:hypothetical protein